VPAGPSLLPAAAMSAAAACFSEATTCWSVGGALISSGCRVGPISMAASWMRGELVVLFLGHEARQVITWAMTGSLLSLSASFCASAREGASTSMV
jgi:hypothetical protein